MSRTVRLGRVRKRHLKKSGTNLDESIIDDIFASKYSGSRIKRNNSADAYGIAQKIEKESPVEKKQDTSIIQNNISSFLNDSTLLPIYAARGELRHKITQHRVIVLLGETGSGKSTQLPQFIRHLSWQKGVIAVSQPRRIAAINLAQRVAQESHTAVGQDVGYTIRFDDCSSSRTRIKYLTDGMLLRELLYDPQLSRYSTIILDEAHERTLQTDLLMGFMQALLRKRNDLRVVIMSATLDAKKFSVFFDNADICFIEGRQFPVTVYYTRESVNDYVDAALRTIFQIHTKQEAGDILVFLTGQEEIDGLIKSIEEYAEGLPDSFLKLLPIPLYSALSPAKLQKAFMPTPSDTRKIIVATNIAETSITVSGVRFVIDCGLAKAKQFRHRLNLESLLVTPISQSSALQRSGRAGREAPGICYRLYPESEFHKLKSSSQPEILRCDIANAVLILKAAGVEDVLNFQFLDRPNEENLLTALEHLYVLSALNNHGHITTLGRQMAELPMSPAHGRVLLSAAQEYKCLASVVDILACLSVDQIFLSPVEKREESTNARACFGREGDHIVLLNAIRKFMETEKHGRKAWCESRFISYRAMKSIMNVRKQLLEYCERYKFERLDGSTDLILRAFLRGFAFNTALIQPDGTYRSIHGSNSMNIHPSSSVFDKKFEAIMFNESVFTTRSYARTVTPIQANWIQEAAPHVFALRQAVL